MQVSDRTDVTPADAADAAAPVIDRECMAEMWEDAGPALFRRMAQLFVQERQRYVAHLHAALRSGSREDLKREAHSLKSAAAYICAERLRLASLRLERAAPTAQTALLARIVAMIEAEADIADIELARAVAEKGGAG